ncbi:SDR family oxidoreductase [Croceicoccus sp. F390]|uniref:SDR family oxidoreductase n=1 Tax=Croceicoccus esteveae TaxID=3075597 RepID=A0ABU2ZE15_9SPHN|nr:SDR family oxidoreductase [Croceicoccus sp. F390]MDT0574842.1 SDR family oxidoreductase [Croceicoccus sp. F390]
MSAGAVLITGGAKRLGSVMARCFADAGYHVIIHYRRSAAAAAALAANLPDASTVEADLGDPAEARAMVERLGAMHPDWRVLVNNAAIFEPDTTQQDTQAGDSQAIFSPACLARAMTINAASPVVLAQTFLRCAKTRGHAGRRVINVIDQKIANMNPDFFSYTMAKQALHAATRMLAMEHAATSDRIYSLCPGAMLPSHDQRSEEHQISGRMNLLERLVEPEELAAAAVFLAQGTAANGQTLFIDAGQHLLDQPRDVLYLARQSTGRG